MEKIPIRRSGQVQETQVVGSNPTDPTTSGTGAAGAKIFQTLWQLKKDGFSEDTLRDKGDCLSFLAKYVDLDEKKEAAKGYIAGQPDWSNA